MKMTSMCMACIVFVRCHDAQRVLKDEEERMKFLRLVLSEVLRSSELREPPPLPATRLFRILKRLSGVEDPYRDLKRRANEQGMRLYEALRKSLESCDAVERVRKALAASIVGNALDLGVAGYRIPSPSELLTVISRCDVVVKGSVFEVLRRSREVAFVLDNAGEAAFDKLLAEALRDEGKKVYAIVKSGAFQNDVTVAEVDELKLYESFDEVVETGTDAASVFLDEVSREVVELLKRVDLIVAKGMANYEYLTEVQHRIGRPVLYLLRAKCAPVAQSLGVEVGSYVAYLSTASV